ncbi:MAG: glutamine--fructose-6-phosphate aminotransferase, partial [Desulfamplus sp.]|nr:glutamine--fructose-6-phosphate aminotransferase [Desulfamplus sp.]
MLSAEIESAQELVSSVSSGVLAICLSNESMAEASLAGDSFIKDKYLGGETTLDTLLHKIRMIKTDSLFFELFMDSEKESRLSLIGQQLSVMIEKEVSDINSSMVEISAADVEAVLKRIEKIKDISWCISREILENIGRIRQLLVNGCSPVSMSQVLAFKRINAVLNSVDRLEVRGRDSAGISLLFILTRTQFENFRKEMLSAGLGDQLKQRTNKTVLVNNCITIHNVSATIRDRGVNLNHIDGCATTAIDHDRTKAVDDNDRITPVDIPASKPESHVAISIVYKYAAEIGSLGDNVAFIRTQIRNDQILQILTRFPSVFSTISAHTRWASVGDITQANCHPVDNEPTDTLVKRSGIIHVSLNGDIDNYPELKKEYESRFDSIHSEITTDTKIIPLQIELYLRQGHPVEEAFRLALNDFHGSHAISMHTDLAPGKLFLAQKGSGQAIFAGISPNHYITASELYGLVEETQKFIKLNGEKKGQILILDQNSGGGISGMRSFDYDGSPIEICEQDIQHSEITSRDIDRQMFPHYFLKEISESPVSVTKTLQNKWKISPDTGLYTMNLGRSVIPESIESDLKQGVIKKIYF